MLWGCQVSLQKGERVVVIDIAPDGWGAVSKEDGTEGYVPVDWLDLHTNSLSAPQTSAPAPREPAFFALGAMAERGANRRSCARAIGLNSIASSDAGITIDASPAPWSERYGIL